MDDGVDGVLGKILLGRVTKWTVMGRALFIHSLKVLK
jgi:hypothetical protein